MFKISPHHRAVLQALFVTFLWSISFVLIKFGLEDIPPLLFAGLRYMLAFLVLLPLLWRQDRVADAEAVIVQQPKKSRFHLPASIKALKRNDWMWLLILGVIYYAVTQGSQFVALAFAPAVSVSLILSFTAVFVALLGIVTLGERPNIGQWLGILLALAGALIYFFPFGLAEAQLMGIVAAVVGMLANSVSSVLGRFVNRDSKIRPLTVTVISMGIGACLLLVGGIILQGVPRLSLQSWLIILWLAVVNTAVAFTLWNHTLRTLSAMESTVINNTMTVQIAILAFLFLGETLNGRELIGLAAVVVGTLLVQIWRRKS
ncbi:MAG: EamA family transporter [Anaerolineales bacterium]|nr:EamA family transporter [Anaerolineales bacterium]